MTKKPRLGIVGFGVQGSVYAGLISDGAVPNMEIGAICDGDPARGPVVESNYPAAPFYTDYLTMLDSGDRRRGRHLCAALSAPPDGH